jgi:hypothetical protein
MTNVKTKMAFSTFTMISHRLIDHLCIYHNLKYIDNKNNRKFNILVFKEDTLMLDKANFFLKYNHIYMNLHCVIITLRS